MANKKIDSAFSKTFGQGYIYKLFKYFVPHKKVIWICSLLILCSIAIGIISPYANAYITDTIIKDQKMGAFVGVALLIIFLEFAGIFASFYKTKLINKYGYQIIEQIREDVFDKITTLSMDYFDKNKTGAIVGKSTAYVDNLASFYTSYIFSFIEHVMRICLIVPCLFICSPVMAAVGAGVFIPIWFVVSVIKKISAKRSEVYYQGQIDAICELYDDINGIKTINRLGILDQTTKEYLAVVKKNYKQNRAQTRSDTFFYTAFDTIYNIAIAGIYILSFILIARGEITFATYVAYIGYQGQLWTPFYTLVNLSKSITSLSGNIKQVFDTLELEDKIISNPNAKPHEIAGDILFENVNFKYENKYALRDINLHIQSGSTTCICGHSASGKSTLVELLERLYNKESGEIIIDKKNIEDIALSSLRRQVCIVSKNVVILDDTIYQNIKFCQQAVTIKECEDAAKMIGLHDQIMQMGGYNVKIKQKSLLSDSFKIKIDLARMIVSKPAIAVYDEALTCLGEQKEREIVKKLIDFYHGKTFIIVTNNKHIFADADNLVFMKNGEISGVGTYEYLREVNADFAKEFDGDKD